MNESENLAALFNGINRKEFAKKHKLRGGDAMIYQHTRGLRPISLEAAVTYAVGFNVPLDVISPSLAGKLSKLLAINRPPVVAADHTLTANQPDGPKYHENVVKFPAVLDPDIEEVIGIMLEADARGRAMALAAVKVALNDASTSIKNAVQ